MAFFKKKSKEEEAKERAEKQKKAEIEEIIKSTNIEFPEVKLPVSERKIIRTAEYEAFLKELQQEPKTFYEKACVFSEKILKIKINPKSKEKIQEKINAAYLNVTPEGVYSFSFLTIIFGSLFVLFLSILGVFDLIFILFLFCCVFGLGFYIYNYPEYQTKVVLMNMSSETVLAILYMIIYMRTNPNLEGALKFAAQNLPGALGLDLKKVVWDIEVGIYSSADIAIASYINKWKEKNAEFAESLHILRGVAVEPGRREMIFKEAINTILNGTRERARHYAAGLRMPMMIINAMGVLLPVMGLVLFPIVMLFMSDVIKPSFLAFGYDVLLPLGLFLITSHVLSTKPPTFSQPEISKLKGIPPLGKMKFGNSIISIWPISLVIFLPFLIIGLLGITSPDAFSSVNFSILITFGIGLAIAIFCLLDSMQKMAARKAIEKIEEEFSVALFQLGNSLSSGIPLESALQKTISNVKNLKIAEFFNIILMNMQKFGYTFEQAIFDKEVGAIWYYPSKLIESVMHTVIESSQKSISAAAESMMTISSYLKNVHEVKEEIFELLGETTSSMRFLSMFLAPMIAGVTVTMAVIIMQILSKISYLMPTITGGEVSAASAAFVMPWSLHGGKLPVSPAEFQLIIGIYVIILSILLSKFLNRIQYGEDIIGERSLTGWTLIFGMTVYAFSWLVTYSLFGNSIAALLTPI
ncbi:MAG: hypothetical protein QXF15_02430 [Candidatus Aenigmatarchaeota archaeon]|nr:type II secretion system F family protein [Candidatus Aenigmarchaeota archaeon]